MKKIIIWLLVIGLLVCAMLGFVAYNRILSPNVKGNQDYYSLFIPTGASLAQVADSLSINEIIDNRADFIWCADLMKYGAESRIKAGKYKITSKWTNRDLISHLRLGKQMAINVTLPAARQLSHIAGIAADKLELDSTRLMSIFNDGSKLEGTNSPIYFSKILPNTYHFNWNTNEREFLSRIDQEYDTFWANDQRQQKSEALGLTRHEVYTLASIVERETNYNAEKPTIAGVYLNRIRQGIALQADPTVVFALGDFSVRRVLTRYLKIDSPYNTYKYPGLPPGPIGLASISSIDAVLNYEDHDYLFFCARPDNSGQHNFASTLQGHNQNARRFQQWLNERGIRK